MTDGLYHKDVLWLPEFTKMIDNYITRALNHKIILSMHCKQMNETTWRRMYDVDVISYYNIKDAEPFEILIENGKVSKVAVRYNFNAFNDISVVYFVTYDNDIFVKTAWLNACKDLHATLNTHKYVS